MRQAQVLVVPSIYPEALGLVAIEGLAAGAVVVASRVGGLAETVIEGETGFQARPGDVPDLASAIARALTASASSASRDALVAAGRRLAEEHDVNRIARDALDGYRSLVASPRNAGVSRSMD
jgi:glycosyltransferase involved in cell wall biosynthesis